MQVVEEHVTFEKEYFNKSSGLMAVVRIVLRPVEFCNSETGTTTNTPKLAIDVRIRSHESLERNMRLQHSDYSLLVRLACVASFVWFSAEIPTAVTGSSIKRWRPTAFHIDVDRVRCVFPNIRECRCLELDRDREELFDLRRGRC